MTLDTPTGLQAALAERYELRHVLGRGGMATVYSAWDRKHQREVAVKVLRPDLAASLGVERFLQEIQIAAGLTHPHILPLYDSGEAAGFLYYVMPCITGGSLRQRLEAQKRLRRDEALAIAAPVADALAYAHRMGIFHRDIKPENILFSQGHPIVADFGIAKALSTAGAAGGSNLTRTGFPLGTPGYMSPEQAAGMTDLDGKTDVYSLAVVIYEMLVGAPPGRWPTEDAVRAGRFLEAPVAHRTPLTEAGPAIESALVRGLAIRHDQRTATPAALMAELTGKVAVTKRKYGEDEVREIVRRATELEATNPTAGGAMTLGGVEALGAEVGVRADLIRSAARSLDPAMAPAALVPARVNPLTGAVPSVLFERVVEGEVVESDFPILAEEIRRVMENAGQVSQLGRTFTWTMQRVGGVNRDMEASVSVRAGRTRILVRENFTPLAGAIFGGIGGGLGGGGLGPILGITIGGLGLHGAVIAAIIPAWFATVYGIARTSFKRSTRKREERLRRLADRLAAVTAELVGRRE